MREGISYITFLLLFLYGVIVVIDDPRDILIPILPIRILVLILLHLVVIILGHFRQGCWANIFQLLFLLLFHPPPQIIVLLLHALGPLELFCQLLHQLDVLVVQDVMALFLVFFLAEGVGDGGLREVVGMGLEVVGLAEVVEDVGVGQGVYRLLVADCLGDYLCDGVDGSLD